MEGLFAGGSSSSAMCPADLPGYEARLYEQLLDNDDEILELMRIIMYNAYSVEWYGPSGYKDIHN